MGSHTTGSMPPETNAFADNSWPQFSLRETDVHAPSGLSFLESPPKSCGGRRLGFAPGRCGRENCRLATKEMVQASRQTDLRGKWSMKTGMGRTDYAIGNGECAIRNRNTGSGVWSLETRDISLVGTRPKHFPIFHPCTWQCGRMRCPRA